MGWTPERTIRAIHVGFLCACGAAAVIAMLVYVPLSRPDVGGWPRFTIWSLFVFVIGVGGGNFVVVVISRIGLSVLLWLIQRHFEKRAAFTRTFLGPEAEAAYRAKHEPLIAELAA